MQKYEISASYVTKGFNRMELFDYQKDLREKTRIALQQPDPVVLAAAPASGKTTIAISIIEETLAKKPGAKVLILAHGQSLIREQWHVALSNRSDLAGKHVLVRSSRTLLARFETSSVFLAIPQSLRNLPSDIHFDLLIVDEAHQWYHSPSVQTIIEKTRPDRQILLTGTPSRYVNKSEYVLVPFTLQELLALGKISDPLIKIAEAAESYALEDYDATTMELKDDVKDETETTLHHVLASILRELLQQNKLSSSPANSEDETWKEVLSFLGKTMFVCRTQDQAKRLKDYFDKRNIKSLVSVSSLGDGREELREFLTNPQFPIFIVVRRGILGFDFPKLANIVDLSFSLNINSVFQCICRLVRVDPDNAGVQKFYLKLCSKETAHLTYFIMSFVVALSHKKYYHTFSEDYRQLKVPVRKEFVEGLSKWSNRKTFPDLPMLLTFRDLRDLRDVAVRGIAYTTFDYVRRQLAAKPQSEEIVRALEQALDCSDLHDYKLKHPAEYELIQKHGVTDQLFVELLKAKDIGDESDSKNRSFLFECMQAAGRYSKMSEFTARHPKYGKWLDQTGNSRILANFFMRRKRGNSRRVFRTDQLAAADQLVADRRYKIKKDGRVFRVERDSLMGRRTRLLNELASDGFHVCYKGVNIPVPLIVYRRYRGPVSPDAVLVHADGDVTNDSFDNILPADRGEQ